MSKFKLFTTQNKKQVILDTSNSSIKPYGLEFGQLVGYKEDKIIYRPLITIGVDRSNGLLYFHQENYPGVSCWDNINANGNIHKLDNFFISKIVKSENEVYEKLDDIFICDALEIKLNEKIEKLRKEHSEEVLNAQYALVCQKIFKGNQVRKLFKMNKLKTLNDYLVLAGNDPEITGLEKFHEKEEKIAIIATGGLRCLSIAATLGKDNKKIPKIILIDNLINVVNLWKIFKDFMENDKLTDTKEKFWENFKVFEEKLKIGKSSLKSALWPGLKFYDPQIQDFRKNMIKLFSENDYNFLRKIVKHVSVIPQDWQDEETFIKINNILKHNNVNKLFICPSNIVGYMEGSNVRLKILNNITKLNPTLSIHTDFVNGEQKNFYFFSAEESKKPEEILKVLTQTK